MKRSSDSFRSSLSEAQGQVHKSPARFRVLVAGRRFGKTHLALVELLHNAWNNSGKSAGTSRPIIVRPRASRGIASSRCSAAIRALALTKPI